MITWFQRLFGKSKIEFVPTYPVPPCKGKRWAIGDIHGCYLTFLALLEQLQLSKEDQLFLLGDIINKGPKSAAVVDEVLRLQKEGYQVFVICGNHEQIVLDCVFENPYQLSFMLEKFKSEDLLQRRNKIKRKYLQFFQSLPYYLELENHFLVHAGFNFNAEDPYTDFSNMIWIRELTPDPAFLKGKHLLRGHVPMHRSIVEHAVKDQRPIIPLDNGCVYWKEREGLGSLFALELNSWELKEQECVDFTMFLGTRMAVQSI